MSRHKPNPARALTTEVVTVSPQIMSGAPVFTDSRVPIKNLFDYLAEGDSIDDFIEAFPSVTREQVVTLLDQIGDDFNPHGNV